MADNQVTALLEALVPELAHVREAGCDQLDLEPLLPKMTGLADLGVVRHRCSVPTPLGTAAAISAVVRDAVDRLTDDHHPSGDRPSMTAQAQMLFRAHYKTQRLSPAEARTRTRAVSGLQERQYRARHEPRLLRLVCQAVLELDREDDLSQWGRALQVGADVPQTVAMYWLDLFRDHYFRLETAAYALQLDYLTALSQLRSGLPSWPKYLATAVYWNTEFSYMRHRFFLRHGPLWFAITDEGCTRLNDSVERIEYHDPFPDEFMAKLRRLYGSMEVPDHDELNRRLGEEDLRDFTLAKAEEWLRRCSCPLDGEIDERCEMHLVLRNCDVLGETVETEFEQIQTWYRTPRFAAAPDMGDLILNYRTPAREWDQADRTKPLS